jgi:5-methylthioadenosine/S-adenosylhomocysteine deaminase
VPGRAILIRQAHIISMDEAIGDLIGDVLVKDGKIVEVTPSIEAPHAAVIDGAAQGADPGFRQHPPSSVADGDERLCGRLDL